MHMVVDRIYPYQLSDELVSSKLKFLTDVQLWPIKSNLDPDQWLNNFTDTERPYAYNILNVFLYFSDTMIDTIFQSNVQSLISSIVSKASSFSEAQTLWREFLSKVVITYVQGEQPNQQTVDICLQEKLDKC